MKKNRIIRILSMGLVLSMVLPSLQLVNLRNYKESYKNVTLRSIINNFDVNKVYAEVLVPDDEIPNDLNQLVWKVEDFEILPQSEPTHKFKTGESEDEFVRGAELLGFSERGKAKLAKIRDKFGANVAYPLVFPTFESEDINPVIIRKRSGEQFSDFQNCYLVDFHNLNQLQYIGHRAIIGNSERGLEVRGLDNHPKLVKIFSSAFSGVNNRFSIQNVPTLKKLETGFIANFKYGSDIEFVLKDLPNAYVNGITESSSAKAKFVVIDNVKGVNIKKYYEENSVSDYEGSSYKTGYFFQEIDKLIIKNIESQTSIDTRDLKNFMKINSIEITDIPNLDSIIGFYGIGVKTVKIANLPKLTKINGFDSKGWGDDRLKNFELSNLPELSYLGGFNNHGIKELNFNHLKNLTTLNGFSYYWVDTDSKDLPVVHIDELTKLTEFIGFNNGYDFTHTFTENNNIREIGGLKNSYWGKDGIMDLSKLKKLNTINTNYSFSNNDAKIYNKVILPTFPYITGGYSFLKTNTMLTELPNPKGHTFDSSYSLMNLYDKREKVIWKNNPHPENKVVFTLDKFGEKVNEGAFNAADGPILLEYYNDSTVIGGAGIPNNITFNKLDKEFTNSDYKDYYLIPYYTKDGVEHKYAPYSSLYLGNEIFENIIESLPNAPTVYDYMKKKWPNKIMKDSEQKIYLVIDDEGKAFLPYFARPFNESYSGKARMKYVNSDYSMGEVDYTIEKRPSITESPTVTLYQDTENTGNVKVVLEKSNAKTYYEAGSTVKVLRKKDNAEIGVNPYTVEIDDQGRSYITILNKDLRLPGSAYNDEGPSLFSVKEGEALYSEDAEADLPPRKLQTPKPVVESYTLVIGGDGLSKAILTYGDNHSSYPMNTEIFVSLCDEDGTCSKPESIGNLNYDNSIIVPAKYTVSAGDNNPQNKIKFLAKSTGEFISEPSEPQDRKVIYNTEKPENTVLDRISPTEGKIHVVSNSGNYPLNSVVVVYDPDGQKVLRGFLNSNNDLLITGKSVFDLLNDPHYSYAKLKPGVKYSVESPGKAISDKADITENTRMAHMVDKIIENDGSIKLKIVNPDGNNYVEGTVAHLTINGKAEEFLVHSNGYIVIPRILVPLKGEEITGATMDDPSSEIFPDNVANFNLDDSNITQVGKVEVVLDQMTGEGIITPLRPDGSRFPEGTFIQFPDYHPNKEFNPIYRLDENGQTRFKNYDMPTDEAGVETVAQVREAGKIYSDDIETHIPKGWDKTVVPSYKSVGFFDGYSVVKLQKFNENGKLVYYPEGTILHIGEINVPISADGLFRIQDDILGRNFVNELVTIEEPYHFGSNPFNVKKVTETPTSIVISYKTEEDGSVSATVKAKWTDKKGREHIYPQGTALIITSANLPEIYLNDDAGTAFISDTKVEFLEKYNGAEAKAKSSYMEESAGECKIVVEKSDKIDIPIQKHIKFRNTNSIIEYLESKKVSKPINIQITGNIENFDDNLIIDAKLFIGTVDADINESETDNIVAVLDYGVDTDKKVFDLEDGLFKFESDNFDSPEMKKILEDGRYKLILEYKDKIRGEQRTLSSDQEIYFSKVNIKENDNPPSSGPVIKVPEPVASQPDIIKVSNINNTTIINSDTDAKIRVGKNGNWYINDKDTRIKADKNSGNNILVGIEDNVWTINGNRTTVQVREHDYKGYDNDKVLKDINKDINYISPKLVSQEHLAYVKGYRDLEFKPEKNITRAEVVEIFYRLLTNPERDKNKSNDNIFKDVNYSDWYYNSVGSMGKGGFITGYPDGNFRGNDYMTRAEFVAIASRFVNERSMGKNFNDISKSYWAKQAIETAIAYDWINGYVGNVFKPQQKITRAEAVTIINKMIKRNTNPEGIDTKGYENFIDNARSAWYYYQVLEAVNN